MVTSLAFVLEIDVWALLVAIGMGDLSAARSGGETARVWVLSKRLLIVVFLVAAIGIVIEITTGDASLSGKISKGSISPPSRATNARSMTELLSTIRGPSGRLPAGNNSSPVTISWTTGRRTQRGPATPMEASNAAS